MERLRASTIRRMLEQAGVAVEDLVFERIVDLAASREEIREALEIHNSGPADAIPSNERVAEICVLLAESGEAHAAPRQPATTQAT